MQISKAVDWVKLFSSPNLKALEMKEKNLLNENSQMLPAAAQRQPRTASRHHLLPSRVVTWWHFWNFALIKKTLLQGGNFSIHSCPSRGLQFKEQLVCPQLLRNLMCLCCTLLCLWEDGFDRSRQCAEFQPFRKRLKTTTPWLLKAPMKPCCPARN